MTVSLALASIAFNRPRMIEEQIRLLNKHLLDPFKLRVYDTSTDPSASAAIAMICTEGGARYRRMDTSSHHEALNFAGDDLLLDDTPYIGFLDHDIFPFRETQIVPKIEEMGFFGVGQRHPATGHLYPWPGFCFFSQEWLAGRPLDFSGLRDGDARNDGDTGSCLWPLFVEEDWKKLYSVSHSYEVIRKPDEYGLQSFGYEVIGDWWHFSNASGWMEIPRPEERESILLEMLATL